MQSMVYNCFQQSNRVRVLLLGNYPRGTGILQVLQLNEGKLDLVTEVT